MRQESFGWPRSSFLWLQLRKQMIFIVLLHCCIINPNAVSHQIQPSTAHKKDKHGSSMAWILIKWRLGSQCPDQISTSFIFYALWRNLWNVFVHEVSRLSWILLREMQILMLNSSNYAHQSISQHEWMLPLFHLRWNLCVCARVCVMNLHAFMCVTSPWTSKDKQLACGLQAHTCRTLRMLLSDLSPPFDFPFFTFQTLFWKGWLCRTVHCIYKKHIVL